MRLPRKLKKRLRAKRAKQIREIIARAKWQIECIKAQPSELLRPVALLGKAMQCVSVAISAAQAIDRLRAMPVRPMHYGIDFVSGDSISVISRLEPGRPVQSITLFE